MMISHFYGIPRVILSKSEGKWTDARASWEVEQGIVNEYTLCVCADEKGLGVSNGDACATV